VVGGSNSHFGQAAINTRSRARRASVCVCIANTTEEARSGHGPSVTRPCPKETETPHTHTPTFRFRLFVCFLFVACSSLPLRPVPPPPPLFLCYSSWPQGAITNHTRATHPHFARPRSPPSCSRFLLRQMRPRPIKPPSLACRHRKLGGPGTAQSSNAHTGRAAKGPHDRSSPPYSAACPSLDPTPSALSPIAEC
jgi:hypothetical protein